jgi:hypothetical protein
LGYLNSLQITEHISDLELDPFVVELDLLVELDLPKAFPYEEAYLLI